MCATRARRIGAMSLLRLSPIRSHARRKIDRPSARRAYGTIPRGDTPGLAPPRPPALPSRAIDVTGPRYNDPIARRYEESRFPHRENSSAILFARKGKGDKKAEVERGTRYPLFSFRISFLFETASAERQRSSASRTLGIR